MADNDNIDKEVRSATLKQVENAIRKGITQEYVEELRDRIVDRTRLGIGVDPETGASKRLKPLKQSYKNRRKKVKGKLAGTTKPAKSNLTLTGQLLKSLTVIKLKLRGAVGFKITVGDKRGLNIDGSQSKIGNKKLVEYLKAQGREFLGFTKSQRNEIAKEIRQIIRKFL